MLCVCEGRMASKYVTTKNFQHLHINKDMQTYLTFTSSMFVVVVIRILQAFTKRYRDTPEVAVRSEYHKRGWQRCDRENGVRYERNHG